MNASIPKNFGSYQLLSELGRGGMGIVFKAYNPEINKICALKILVPTADTDQQSLQRFLAETRIATTLPKHPNIVAAQDIGEIDGAYFIAMDYVEGVEFSTITKHQRLPAKQLYDILTQLSSALTQLHKSGIVHRDLKPSNIMINQDGRPLIMDFGIAKELARQTELTRSGTFVGTLAYMSPEQADNAKAVDHRADVYSLGAILYEALTGRPPHVGSSATKLLVSLISREPPLPSSINPKVDSTLEQICLKALCKDPEYRFQSMEEFHSACLLKSAQVPSIPFHPPSPPRQAPAPTPGPFPPASEVFGAPPAPAFAPSPGAFSAPLIPPHPTQSPEAQSASDPLFDTIDPEPLMTSAPVAPEAAPIEAGPKEVAPKNLLTRSPEDIAADKKRKRGMAAALALILVLGLGVLAWALSGGEEKGGSEAQISVTLLDLNLAEEQWVSKSPIELKGTLSAKPFLLTVNGAPVTVSENKFAHQLQLNEGEHTLQLSCRELESSEPKELKSLKIRVDTVAPQLTIDPLPLTVTKALLRIRGECNDSTAPVYVNGQDSMIDSRRFSALLKLKAGENIVRITAKDKAGNERVISKKINYQPPRHQPPAIVEGTRIVRFRLKSPPEKITRTKDESIAFIASFKPPSATLTVNGQKLETKNGLLNWTAPLQEGQNEFRFKLVHKKTEKQLKVKVFRDSTAPLLTIKGMKDNALISAKVVTLELRSNEPLQSLSLNDTKLELKDERRVTIRRDMKKDGERRWRFVAEDLLGNKSTKIHVFKIDNSPPQFVYKKPKFLPKMKSQTLKIKVLDPHLVSVTMQRSKKSEPESIQLSPNHSFELTLKSAELRRGVTFLAKDSLGHEKALVARSELFYIYDLAAWNSLKKKEVRLYEAKEVQRQLGGDFSFVSMDKFYCRRAWSYIATYKHKSGLLFRLIPGSVWTFGYDNNSKEKRMEEAWLNYKRKKDLVSLSGETPKYSAQISPFLMSVSELTVKDYYTMAKQKIPKDLRLRHEFPVIKSWTESVSWCKKMGFRLPSEAEWEYACRAGTKTRYFWGPELDKKAYKFAWLKFNSGPRLRQCRMHIEAKAWNAFGLVDMLGNVEEWCQDHWYSNYAGAPMNGRPRPLKENANKDSKHYRMRPARGGSYYSTQFGCRVARRTYYHYLKNDTEPKTGIRAVLPLPEKVD